MAGQQVDPVGPGRRSVATGLRGLDPRKRTGAVGLVRLATVTTVRITAATVRGSLASTVDLARDVSSGEPMAEVVDRRVEAVRSGLVRVLGLAGHDFPPALPVRPGETEATDLRAVGDELLRRLSDPAAQAPGGHPAFARILGELLPDEARILRFMALAGPQPAIDVRTRTPLGVGSELIAGGINLVAQMAGCADPERDQEYLANLDRLGMIYFCDEQVADPRRYSFVEAQPVTSAAMARVRKSTTVYRSIRISRFGLQFCEVCFTLDGYDAGGWLEDVR
jgi:hypothetical protein